MPQPKKHASTRRRRNKASTAATLSEREADDRSKWTAKNLRDEIDLRNEDRPDGEKLSKGGGKAGMMATLAADDFSIPSLPEKRGGWHDLTEDWWFQVWMSPMSEEWHPETDYFNVVMAAMHFDDMMTASSAVERQKADTAFVKRVAALGLTPYDRRRLEWTIETADAARAAGQKRRGESPPGRQTAQQPKKGEDPRAGLTLVG